MRLPDGHFDRMMLHRDDGHLEGAPHYMNEKEQRRAVSRQEAEAQTP